MCQEMIKNLKQQYYSKGFVLLRDIIPRNLVEEIKKDSLHIRESLVPDTTRDNYVYVKAFRYSQNTDLYKQVDDLKLLKEIIKELFSENHHMDLLNSGGILLCEADHLCTTSWHRDHRENGMGLDEPIWDYCETDYDSGNAVQISLLKDDNLWVVPGSHNRHDTKEEAAVFPFSMKLHNKEPEFNCMSEPVTEKMIMHYITSMPNSYCIERNPGDILIYRSWMWHLGLRVPRNKRLTWACHVSVAGSYERFLEKTRPFSLKTPPRTPAPHTVK